MRPRGLRAFADRKADRSAVYSYEQPEPGALSAAYKRRFRREEQSWRYFQSTPPLYRKAAIHWVMSAKKDETRERRLTTLIEDSAVGRPIGPLLHPFIPRKGNATRSRAVRAAQRRCRRRWLKSCEAQTL
jgi:hypothetical protein